jgi:GTP cyclohydrolase II
MINNDYKDGVNIVASTMPANLPTPFGTFKIMAFKDDSNKEHAAIYMGDIANNEPVLARIHSECLTGDTLFSLKCDCGFQLKTAMQQIAKEKRGVILYVRQEGRGIGLFNKIQAYHLQDEGLDTIEANIHLGYKADERDYGVGASILREIGIKKMRLMTNNPVKRIGLEGYGLEIVENVPIEVEPNQYNARYLKTKKERMGHTLHLK